ARSRGGRHPRLADRHGQVGDPPCAARPQEDPGMTDDELIERLRRTLQTEAAAITPGPPGEQATSYPASDAPRRLRAGWPLAVGVAAAAVAAAVGLTVAYWPG